MFLRPKSLEYGECYSCSPNKDDSDGHRVIFQFKLYKNDRLYVLGDNFLIKHGVNSNYQENDGDYISNEKFYNNIRPCTEQEIQLLKKHNIYVNVSLNKLEQMSNIKQILEGIYSNPELRKSIVPLFMGDPGIGKTAIIEQFAKEKGANLVEFITSQRNPFEISGLAMPDKETKQMSFWDFDTILKMRDGDILFFDEVLNGNPIVLNACLTILEGRKMISGKQLPNIMIIAAANYQGMCPLTPQIKERFVWYDIKFDLPLWREYMINAYGLTPSIINKLGAIIRSEKFDGLNQSEKVSCNFNSARSITKAIQSIVHKVPTPYEDTLLTILQEPVKNILEEPVKIKDDEELLPGQMMPWLDLIRLIKNVK